MRNLSAIFFILVFSIIACNQPVKGRNGVTYKSAVQYNDYIVGRQTKLMQHILDFSKAANNSLDSAEKMLAEYINETAQTVEDIKGMPAYKGDTSLRDAAARSFSFYKNVFQNDYTRIIQIRKKGEEMTNEDVEEMQRIVDKITREEEGFDKSFHNAQKRFADKNNMKLAENEMQKKFEKEIGQ
ncbi:MAG TPA: hypothetical protein VK483_14185 [Chitinophagaceae bacterium]|nr:hypothetical protein [Chitinophagaceae bacterium]